MVFLKVELKEPMNQCFLVVEMIYVLNQKLQILL